MNDNSQARPALNRSDVEAALARIAVATFTYYPEKATEEPGYLVDEDVDWAMGPLRAMDAGEFERCRGVGSKQDAVTMARASCLCRLRLSC